MHHLIDVLKSGNFEWKLSVQISVFLPKLMKLSACKCIDTLFENWKK